jgi:protein required for attachment to host cells
MSRILAVADGGQARLLRIEGLGPRTALTELRRLERPTRKLAAREMTSDLTGRVFSYAGRRRSGGGRPMAIPHGAQSDFDPHAEEVRRFAKRLARLLREWQRRGDLVQLELICEPRFLGVLRSQMPKALQSVVKTQRPRDLVHATIKQLERLIGRSA